MTGFLLDELRKPGSKVDGGVPDGDPATAWDRRTMSYRLVSPLNRRKFTVIVVGCGLAGAGCAAALGELGYDVKCFTYHDSPRRAHSIAAQSGINSPRSKKVDNDSILRFVKDTVEGGDFRSREADCFRLGEESLRVIDHMNAIGAPFAREYGGQLARRSFGGVQVSRTYYTRGQTGQQLELAASQALQAEIHEFFDCLPASHDVDGFDAIVLASARLVICSAGAVIGVPDERLGEVGAVYIVLRDGAEGDESEVISFARERLANFKVPRHIRFTPSLPMNSTGKVVKAELRAAFAAEMKPLQ
jgi:FAD binding domain/AMP-binding enzyme C-terminal domain